MIMKLYIVLVYILWPMFAIFYWNCLTKNKPKQFEKNKMRPNPTLFKIIQSAVLGWIELFYIDYHSKFEYRPYVLTVYGIISYTLFYWFYFFTCRR